MTGLIKRIYVDTSVVLGKFDIDETRRQQTEVFWQAVRSGEIIAVLSDVMEIELRASASRVRQYLSELPNYQKEWVEVSIESNTLAKRYITENVISENSLNDCRHIALASLHADGIVSWNLKDMVKREKKYNQVNVTTGYRKIKILTPDRYKEIYHEV
jgi:predicted nucleic acid-binding protein